MVDHSPSERHNQQPQQQNLQQDQTYQGQKVVASRQSREGDPGYQLSTVYSQMTIILEDGTEKVVKADDVTTPEAEQQKKKQEQEQQQKQQK